MSWNPIGCPAPTINPPNIADYATFLANVVGVPSQYLKLISNLVTDSSGAYVVDSNAQQVTSSPLVSQFQMSLNIAIDIVNVQLAIAAPDVYTLAVYNLAADRLINYGMDIDGQTFFKDARKTFNVFSQVTGIVTSTSDESTSMSQMVPDSFKNLTLQDLQMFATPYGRAYLGFAQSVGTLWGLS